MVLALQRPKSELQNVSLSSPKNRNILICPKMRDPKKKRTTGRSLFTSTRYFLDFHEKKFAQSFFSFLGLSSWGRSIYFDSSETIKIRFAIPIWGAAMPIPSREAASVSFKSEMADWISAD